MSEMISEQVNGLPVGIRYWAIGLAQTALRNEGFEYASDYVQVLFDVTIDSPEINAAKLGVLEALGQTALPEV